MRFNRKLQFGAASLVAATLALAGCSGGNSAMSSESGGSAAAAPVKMCVLVADATSSEALGFKNYYANYIAKNFNVQFTYSDELKDANAEKSAMENFIANNCKAIISFASADRGQQIQMAEDAGIYYSVATGTLTADQYNQFKTFPHYVGAIGPSLDVERQAGYDMAFYFIKNGDTKFAIFGAGIPFYIDMHIYRVAGMLTALAEEPSTSYGGAKDFDAILGKIMADGTVKIADFKSDVYQLTGYLEGWNFEDSAWQAQSAQVVASNPQVILAAGTGFAVFGAAVANSDIRIGDIDAYTEDNKKAMEQGTLAYLAGKFTSSTGPIFAATLSAVDGAPIRADGDTAFALDQGYWVATSVDQFQKVLDADSADNPVYNKDNLSPWIDNGATYSDFADFVSKYTFADLVH